MYVQAMVQPLQTCWGLLLPCPQQSLKAFNTSTPIEKRNVTFCLCSYWQMLPNLWFSTVQQLWNISTGLSTSPWWHFQNGKDEGILTSLGDTGRTHMGHRLCSDGDVASGSTWAPRIPTHSRGKIPMGLVSVQLKKKAERPKSSTCEWLLWKRNE